MATTIIEVKGFRVETLPKGALDQFMQDTLRRLTGNELFTTEMKTPVATLTAAEKKVDECLVNARASALTQPISINL
jgi:hypothetical protein